MFKFIKHISKTKNITRIKESTEKISDNLNKIVFHKKLSNEILDEIEEALLLKGHRVQHDSKVDRGDLRQIDKKQKTQR